MLTETDRIIPGIYLACTHCKTGVINALDDHDCPRFNNTAHVQA